MILDCIQVDYSEESLAGSTESYSEMMEMEKIQHDCGQKDRERDEEERRSNRSKGQVVPEEGE